MYRFLDKRFYNSESVSMDLIEFACGHVGLTESDNVAILKRRLAAANRGAGGDRVPGADAAGGALPEGQGRRLARAVPAGRRKDEGGRMKDEPKESVGSDSSFILHPSALSLATEYYRLWDADHADAAGAARSGTGPGVAARPWGGGEGADRVPGAGDEEALAGLPIAERGGAEVFTGGDKAASAGAAARGGPRDGRGPAAHGTGSGPGDGNRPSGDCRRRGPRCRRRSATPSGAACWTSWAAQTAPEAFVQRLCLEELARR